MPDLSWLPLMGFEAMIIGGIVGILFIFFHFGLPRITEYKLKIAEIKTSASKGILSEDISEKLKNIEETLSKDAETRKERQTKVDERFDLLENTVKEIASNVNDLEESYSVVSQKAMENQFFSEKRVPFIRLRAFRGLIAARRNGRIKDSGLKLIKDHPEDWLNVMETKLEIEIADHEYYSGVMKEIEKKFFSRGLGH
ncbi:MAG: hypothetical protein LBI06_02650 [Treponema sp.]|nr:hypothetical protein [Treponema sp.]